MCSTECYIQDRAFKTAYFARQAKAARVSDGQLCETIEELRRGQGDSLGAGVWKKRMDSNRRRAIVINKAGAFWVFVFLFAKKDQENITHKELEAFKKLSKDYRSADIERLIEYGEVEEICHESGK